MTIQQGETSRDLIDTARRHGYRVTAVMLKKWHLFGLLLRPRQHQLGRNRAGKSLGSVTVYPPGTSAQLLRLLEIRSEGGRFNPERTLWRLWWEGWPVEQKLIRARLEVDSRPSNIKDAVRQLVSEPLPPPLAGMRQRVTAEGLATLLELMFRALEEQKPGQWRLDSGMTALYKAAGLERLQESVSDDQPPIGAKPIAQSVMDLFSSTSRKARRVAVTDADSDTLEQARHDLRTVATISMGVWPVVSSLRELSGSNAGRDFIAHYQRFGFDALPDAVVYVMALRRKSVYAALFDLLNERSGSIAADLKRAIRVEHDATIKPPRRRQPSGGTTRRESPPACAPSLSPSPPPNRDAVSSRSAATVSASPSNTDI